MRSEESGSKGAGEPEELKSPSEDRGLVSSILAKLAKLWKGVVTLGRGLGPAKGKVGASSKSMPRSFAEYFEKRYGTSHPAFTGRSFAEAADFARRSNRFCLILIVSNQGSGKSAKADETLCKTLTDQRVAEFINERFVLWATTANGPGGAAAIKRLGVSSIPFLGVVHTSAKDNKPRVVALHHCNPPPSPGQMRGWMGRLLDLNEAKLQLDAAEQQRIEAEVKLVKEQERDYRRAVRADAQQARQEAEEEKRRQREAEEEKLREEERQRLAKEDAARRQGKRQRLENEPEPPADLPAGDVTTVMLRMPDGGRLRRRFLATDRMEKVFDWADCQEVDLRANRLACAFPRMSLGWPADAATTLAAAGLGKQAVLFVEAIADAKAETEGGGGGGRGKAAHGAGGSGKAQPKEGSGDKKRPARVSGSAPR